jgi:hypothetical protein
MGKEPEATRLVVEKTHYWESKNNLLLYDGKSVVDR